MEVAVLQLDAKCKSNKYKFTPYDTLDEQLDYLCKLRKTKLINTDLVVFHDDWLITFRQVKPKPDQVYPIPGLITDKVGAVAKKLGLFIAIRVWERGQNDGIGDSDENVYDTCVLFDRDGNIALKSRRSHFVRGYSKGNSIEIAKTEIGNIGMIVCGEIYTPEIMRIMCLKGANIIIHFHGLMSKFVIPVPLFRRFMKKKLPPDDIGMADDICDAVLWQSTPNLKNILYTRMYENHCSIIGAHSVGHYYVGNHKLQVGGHSYIATPDGHIKFASKTRKQILIKNINVEKISNFQQYIFNERRINLYNDILSEYESNSNMSISDLIMRRDGINPEATKDSAALS